MTSIISGIIEIIEFYTDWKTDGTAIRTIQEGDSLWSDGTTGDMESPATDMTTGVRSFMNLTDITVPNGLSLDKYIIHSVEALVAMPAALAGVAQDLWSGTNQYDVGGKVGVQAYYTGYTGKIVVTSGVALFSNTSAFDNAGGYTGGNILAAPVKVRIVCSLK